MDTKSVNLTEEEIKVLMNHHRCSGTIEDKMERLNYFHKRLKSFNEVETKPASIGKDANSPAWPS